MLKHTKKNFLEIGKDIKGIVCSSVCLVKDTLSVPISICKDVRDGVVSSKNKAKGSVEFKETSNSTVNEEPITNLT